MRRISYHVEKKGRYSSDFSYFDYDEYDTKAAAVAHMKKEARQDPHAEYRVVRDIQIENTVAQMPRTCEHKND